jgi:hypothetical protein
MGPVEKQHRRPHSRWPIVYTKTTTTKSWIKTVSRALLMLPLNINLRFVLRTATNKYRLTTAPSTNPQASASSTSLPQEHVFGSQIEANGFGDWNFPHNTTTTQPPEYLRSAYQTARPTVKFQVRKICTLLCWRLARIGRKSLAPQSIVRCCSCSWHQIYLHGL